MECAGWFTWSEGHVMTGSIYEVKAEFFKTLAHPARIRARVASGWGTVGE